MTIYVGGLGEALEVLCPNCNNQMRHWCHASAGSIRYSWDCKDCELSLKSDRTGYAKLSKGASGVSLENVAPMV